MGDQLAGKRIFVVEDEYFIASDLARVLRERNAVVIGPTGDLNTGLSLAGEAGIDAAILDVNLAGANSFAIADRLASDAVPYMFLTGYDGWSLPDAHRGTPHLVKPFQANAVLGCIEALLDGGAR